MFGVGTRTLRGDINLFREPGAKFVLRDEEEPRYRNGNIWTWPGVCVKAMRIPEKGTRHFSKF